MLVCPKCQFENPNTNKFCQKCGTSLSHKVCQDCHTQVPLNAETCDNCGTFTGTVWWAIISKDSDATSPTTNSQPTSLNQSDIVLTKPSEDESPTLAPPESQTSQPLSNASRPSLVEDNPEVDEQETLRPATPEASLDEPVTQPQLISSNNNSQGKDTTVTPKPAVLYLDPQQRYRLIEPLSIEQYTALKETQDGAQFPVLDCQPFQKSLLEALQSQKQEDSQSASDVTTSATLAEFNSSHLKATKQSDSWKLLSIPAIAQPYIAFQETCYPSIPQIHDAWQLNGEVVVLLENRSNWQLLSELWESEELSSLQVIYWLDEMAKLWQMLEPWHCRQSLLEISNLRVDEDQSLGLGRLYPEKQEVPPKLKDLGQTWQNLFEKGKRTQFTGVAAIFEQLYSNQIQTIDELRSHLKKLVREQDRLPITEVSPYSVMDLEDMPTCEDIESPPTVLLPMQLLSLDDAGCTDIGRQREQNEDCFGIQTQVKKQETPTGRSLQARGLYILCDGMGGHAGGEVASAMAVEQIKNYFSEHWQDKFPTEETIRDAVRVANQAIYDVNQENSRSGSGRMGTTLAMILIQNKDAAIAHVGDSRIYRLTRKCGLEQMSVDHEVGMRELKRGVEPAIAYSRPDAYQLTQALGPRNEQFINPDVEFLEINEDTLFILCSDGLSDNDLIEQHWQTHLAPLLSSRANLDQGIVQLIDLANEHNGYDNITAILIRVKVRPNFEQQQFL
jgi:protein phosphatase